MSSSSRYIVGPPIPLTPLTPLIPLTSSVCLVPLGLKQLSIFIDNDDSRNDSESRKFMEKIKAVYEKKKIKDVYEKKKTLNKIWKIIWKIIWEFLG